MESSVVRLLLSAIGGGVCFWPTTDRNRQWLGFVYGVAGSCRGLNAPSSTAAMGMTSHKVFIALLSDHGDPDDQAQEKL